MEKTYKDIPVVFSESRAEWRKWLEKNGKKEKEVWLVIYHKKSETPSILLPEAVEEALCYGWIDSLANKRDHESVYQRFSPRKATSNWSPTNIARAKKLIAEGLMTEEGMKAIETGKKKGKWVEDPDA